MFSGVYPFPSRAFLSAPPARKSTSIFAMAFCGFPFRKRRLRAKGVYLETASRVRVSALSREQPCGGGACVFVVGGQV